MRDRINRHRGVIHNAGKNLTSGALGEGGNSTLDSCLANSNRSPAPLFRPIRPPHIANYSSLACLNEPEALDERLQIRVMQSFDVYR